MFYRIKLLFVFLAVRLPFLRFLLSKKQVDQLPLGWNNYMFWVMFKSGGKKYFSDYACKLNPPTSYKPKAVVKKQYKLSEKDIQNFYEKGFVGPFTVMPPEEAEELRHHLEHLATHTKSKVHDKDLIQFVSSDSDGDGSEFTKEFIDYIKSQVNMDNRHLEDEALLNLLQHPAIVERCAQLLGENLLMWRSHFFPIAPKSEGTPWHQATSFMNDWKESIVQPPDYEELFQVTAWIALTDTHKSKACLKIVRDSQWELYPIFLNKSDSKEYSNVYGKYDGEVDFAIKEEDVNYLEMKAGECVIFSERCLHGAADNHTNDWRWAVNARIVRTDTRVYTDNMLNRDGESVTVYQVKNKNLDNWKAVLMRGEDKYGLNRLYKKEKVHV